MPALNTSSDTDTSILVIDRFSYAYPGATDLTLRDVCLQIGPGECHLLEGPTGSGKSTLLKAIRGLLPSGQQSGEIRLSGGPAEAFSVAPGLVQQNPKAQLLCTHLGADIAFGLENHCVAPAEMIIRAEDALKIVGLNRPLQFPVDVLSMGQQYRACIAGQLVMEPLLVMLDEPVAQLDPQGRKKTLEVIRQLKRSGRAVLICEHHSAPLHDVIDRSWRLDKLGRLTEIPGPSLPVADNGRVENVALQSHCTVDECKQQRAVIRVADVTFSHPHGGLDLSGLEFCVGKGECIAICGGNGSGKTTLIRAIAGLVKPQSGTVEVFGAQARLSDLRGRLSVLFQDPAKQLFETTVFDEVAFSAYRTIAVNEQVAAWVNELLDDLGIGSLARVSPHGLSYGQKHLVGLAAVLASRPEILLLDDPFAGLDRDSAVSVMQLVTKVSRKHGMTVIWTTHDPASLTGWADRVVDISYNQFQRRENASQTVPSEIDSTTLPPARKFSLPTGIMLSLCMMLSMLAFAARTPELLIGLSGINLLLLLFYSREPVRVLKKSGILLFWQAALIILLYIFRFGLAEGALSGGQVAWQLFLAFWPGMIFMAANSQPRIVRTLAKVLPQRTAFVCATCLRFLPMLLAEMQQIREIQILRGARILVTDLKNPRSWPDWFRCLLIPTLIQTLCLADGIATAATARDFGIYPQRTAWPGD